jgi:hypothetical protein
MKEMWPKRKVKVAQTYHLGPQNDQFAVFMYLATIHICHVVIPFASVSSRFPSCLRAKALLSVLFVS